MMRFLFAAALITTACAPAHAATFDFVTMGNGLYSDRETAQLVQLIDQVNKLRPAFTLHLGDITANRNCPDSEFFKVKSIFDRSDPALIYTPGDAEWRDCYRSIDRAGRLARVREIFFPDDRSLGVVPITLERQSATPGFSLYRENALWRLSRIIFATLNIPGPTNGLEWTGWQVEEYHARNQANLAWLRVAFARAQRPDIAALVLATQSAQWADSVAPLTTGYQDLLRELRALVANLHKPVLLLNANGHRFTIERSLRDAKGRVLENFTRVEMFGAPDVHAVLVSVDDSDPEIFTIRELSRK